MYLISMLELVCDFKLSGYKENSIDRSFDPIEEINRKNCCRPNSVDTRVK